ncbi:RNA polymerase II mediator complex subunit [Coemansia erecta]|uniref:Mediator of RNA polymerase II transcription subunit 10 n=1 Tax=Coemansia erecta TaxID=147472 RepID=A0A9W7Y1M3_9FUNG|nr:RNA polymerase II mediator complex subunit [Coemansia erecta]
MNPNQQQQQQQQQKKQHQQNQNQNQNQPQLPVDFNDDDRSALEAQIRESLETLSQIRVTVENHESASGEVLEQRVDRLVRGLAQMHTMKDRLNVNVPEEVLAYIKDGRNPDEFTSKFMERVASENQFTNGKISALTNFKQEYENKLKEFFPDEAAEILGHEQPS